MHLLPFIVASSLVIHITQNMPLSFSLFFLFWFESKSKKETQEKERNEEK